MSNNCEVKNAKICFECKIYAEHTLDDLKVFLEESHHTSTDQLLEALIKAIGVKIGVKESICVEIGGC